MGPLSSTCIAGSIDLLPRVEALNFYTSAESDHCLLSLSIRCPVPRPPPPHQDASAFPPRWTRATEERCVRHLASQPLQQRLQAVTSITDPGQATAELLAILGETLATAQPRRAGRRRASPRPADADWFTEECRQLRTAYLRAWRRTGPNSTAAVEARRLYRACIRRSKRAARAATVAQLKALLKEEPLSFWRRIKGRRLLRAVQGSKQGWQQYVAGLLGTALPVSTAQHGRWPVQGVPSGDALNQPFTAEELDAALKRLRRNKAADLDGLRAELLKCGAGLDQPLLHLCNLYLANGSVPPELARAWVKPIPKAGAQAPGPGP